MRIAQEKADVNSMKIFRHIFKIAHDCIDLLARSFDDPSFLKQNFFHIDILPQ